MSTTKYINPASNISYTAKDFLTIFPDLLALTKELTSRWDPSISNESDPGVVLLELNAILADKLNYNIDKNILEAFPMSLTQMGSAKKIFSLLGYKMKWYQSAWSDITLAWIGEKPADDEDGYVIVPTFQTVTDDSGSLVYTLVCPVTADLADGEFKPNDDSTTYLKLPFNNETTSTTVIRAIQGLSLKYEINGEQVIRVSNLDSNNRLYFSSTDIAENGVFIKNTGSTVYDWECKENLLTEKLGNKYFEFGVTDDLYSCYLEFPEDAEDMFKDGIEIVYISTSGATGNMSINTMTKFTSEVYIDRRSKAKESITLNSDTVTITNLIEGTGGADPESIDDAYKNYKRLVGTFDTLVTLRDYMNAIMRTGLVSNCFVCDSTNDAQTSYVVKATINGIDSDQVVTEAVTTKSSTKVLGDVEGYYSNGVFYEDPDFEVIIPEEQTLGKFCADLGSIDLDVYYHSEDVDKFIKINNDVLHTAGKTDPAIDSISVKLYLLMPQANITNSTLLANTFKMIPNQSLLVVKTAIEENKHIGVNYADMLPTTDVNPRPCMFKNKYLITARIYPTIKLTDDIRTELKNAVVQAFYDNLNASEVTFGNSVLLENISAIILNADDRIKTVYVDSVNYDTYAVYYTEVVDEEDETKKTGSFYEILISDKDSAGFECDYVAPPLDNRKVYKKGDIIYQYNSVTGQGTRYRCIRNNVTEYTTSAWVVDEYDFTIDYDKFADALKDKTHAVGNLNYGRELTFYTGSDCQKWYKLTATGRYDEVNLADYGIKQTAGTLYYNTASYLRDSVSFSISKATQIRDYIFAKSILAGKTPLIEAEETAMDYSFLNPYVKTYKEVAEIEGNTTIDISQKQDYKYTLRNNELIQFYAPEYNDITTYSDYTKYEYHLTSEVNANSSRQLGNGEWIVFYSRPTTDSTGIYEYHGYSEGAVINLSFSIAAGDSPTQYFTDFIGDPGSRLLPGSDWRLSKVGNHIYLETYTNYRGSLPLAVSNNVANITTSSLVLVDLKTAKALAISSIELDNSCYCYWILNTMTSTDGNKYDYILFGENDTQRILGNGEYFIYTDASLLTLNIYGQGTKILRDTAGTKVRVDANIDYLSLFDSGAIATSGKFYVPKQPLYCIKNHSTYLSENCKVWLDKKTGKTNYPTIVELTKDGTKGWIEKELARKAGIDEGSKTDPEKHITIGKTSSEAESIKDKTIIISSTVSGTESAAVYNLYQYKDDKYLLLKENISSKTGYAFVATEDVMTLAFEPLTTGATLTIIITASTEVSTPLDYFEIRYSADGETDYINKLDSIDNINAGWDALSMLQLTFNNDAGLVLLEGQEVIIYGDNYTLIIDGPTITNPTKTTNHALLNNVKGKIITVKQKVDSAAEIIPFNLYEYISTATTEEAKYTLLARNIATEAGYSFIATKDIMNLAFDPSSSGSFVIKIEYEATGTTIAGSNVRQVNIPALTFSIPEITSDEYKTVEYSYALYPCTLFSDVEIHTSSAGKIDITLYDDYGNPIYSNISIGQYNYSSSPLAASTLQDGGIVLSITEPDESRQVAPNSVVYPVLFIPGDYITRLTSSSSEIEYLKMHFLCSEEIRKDTVTGLATYTIASKPASVTRVYYLEDDIEEAALLELYSEDLFECKLNNESREYKIERNKNTKLLAGEYIIVYYKDPAYDQYFYHAYGEGTVVKFTFDVFTKGAPAPKYKSEMVDYAVARTLVVDGVNVFDDKHVGSINNPQKWNINITQRHYNVELAGMTTEEETLLIIKELKNFSPEPRPEKWTNPYELDSSRTFEALISTDLKKVTYLADDEPRTYTYDKTTGTVTFKKAPESTGYLVFITSNLKYIDGSDIHTMYTDPDKNPTLHNCNKTPVIFKIANEYDPSSYDLPIYIAAKIKLRAGLTKLNATESITIDNPEKYVYNTSIDEAKIPKYKQLVMDLDTKKAFNYTYKPTEEELIADPLLPASFLNSNHPFNKFTICEYIGTTTDLNVVEKE